MSDSKMKLIIFSILLIVFCLLVFIPVPIAEGAPIAQKQAEQEQILNEIEQYQTQLDILSNEYTEAQIRLNEANSEIARLEEEIQITQGEIEENQNQLREQAIYTYKYGNVSYLSVVLNATSFENFVTNLEYSERIMNHTNDLIEQQEILKSQLQTDLAAQQQAKIEATEAAAAAQSSMNTANAIIADLQADYDRLDVEIATLIAEQERQQTTAAQQSYMAEATTSAVQQTVESVSVIPTNNGNAVVDRAYSKIGCPYSWGGTTSAGFDCSGFVSYCLTGQEGVRLGTTASFIGWPQVSDPQPGDVCVVHNSSHQHTGIYVGGGMMVHASTYGVGVIESPVSGDMIYVRYPG